MSYKDDAAALEAALSDPLARLRSLDDVLRWMTANALPVDRVEAVTQDEFTHDLFFPLDASRWLAFGAT